MALRLIEIVLPEESSKRVEELLKEHTVLCIWHLKTCEGQIFVRILLPAEVTEAVIDLLKKQFWTVDGFRIVLLPVEASIPRLEEPEEALPKKQQPLSEKDSKTNIGRISREEPDAVRLTPKRIPLPCHRRKGGR